MYRKKTDEEKKITAQKRRIVDIDNIKNELNRGIITRLNKVSGQIEGVKRMIDDNRYFMETIIQLRAVRSSLKSIENNMLKDIFSSLLSSTTLSENEIDKKIEELRIILNDKC
ncbi:MAG: metal-sensing transcriptional repressor [Alphaproteobacteria bacterium]|nr:metal-sensing transcriptional repressor [Alphaproteobacteria bacterium]